MSLTVSSKTETYLKLKIPVGEKYAGDEGCGCQTSWLLEVGIFKLCQKDSRILSLSNQNGKE